MADSDTTLRPLSGFLTDLAGACQRHDRDLKNLAGLITALGDQTSEQGETISDLRDQVGNLANITAGLGRLVGQRGETEAAVDLATAPAPATAPPAAPPRPPRKAPAASPAPSGPRRWPSDTDEGLRAEEERRALVASYGLPRISRLREQWLAFRCGLPDSDEGGSTRAFMSFLRDRVQPLSRSQRSEFLCGCRVLGFLLPARGCSSIGARCVIAPAYRRKR